MLSHEMLGLFVSKRKHSSSYLVPHTDRLMEHKSTQKDSHPLRNLLCRQLIFQHKVKLQSSRERMVFRQLDIHLEEKIELVPTSHHTQKSIPGGFPTLLERLRCIKILEENMGGFFITQEKIF